MRSDMGELLTRAANTYRTKDTLTIVNMKLVRATREVTVDAFVQRSPLMLKHAPMRGYLLHGDERDFVVSLINVGYQIALNI